MVSSYADFCCSLVATAVLPLQVHQIIEQFSKVLRFEPTATPAVGASRAQLSNESASTAIPKGSSTAPLLHSLPLAYVRRHELIEAIASLLQSVGQALATSATVLHSLALQYWEAQQSPVTAAAEPCRLAAVGEQEVASTLFSGALLAPGSVERGVVVACLLTGVCESDTAVLAPDGIAALLGAVTVRPAYHLFIPAMPTPVLGELRLRDGSRLMTGDAARRVGIGAATGAAFDRLMLDRFRVLQRRQQAPNMTGTIVRQSRRLQRQGRRLKTTATWFRQGFADVPSSHAEAVAMAAMDRLYLERLAGCGGDKGTMDIDPHGREQTPVTGLQAGDLAYNAAAVSVNAVAIARAVQLTGDIVQRSAAWTQWVVFMATDMLRRSTTAHAAAAKSLRQCAFSLQTSLQASSMSPPFTSVPTPAAPPSVLPATSHLVLQRLAVDIQQPRLFLGGQGLLSELLSSADNIDNQAISLIGDALIHVLDTQRGDAGVLVPTLRNGALLVRYISHMITASTATATESVNGGRPSVGAVASLPRPLWTAVHRSRAVLFGYAGEEGTGGQGDDGGKEVDGDDGDDADKDVDGVSQRWKDLCQRFLDRCEVIRASPNPATSFHATQVMVHSLKVLNQGDAFLKTVALSWKTALEQLRGIVTSLQRAARVEISAVAIRASGGSSTAAATTDGTSWSGAVVQLLGVLETLKGCFSSRAVDEFLAVRVRDELSPVLRRLVRVCEDLIPSGSGALVGNSIIESADEARSEYVKLLSAGQLALPVGASHRWVAVVWAVIRFCVRLCGRGFSDVLLLPRIVQHGPAKRLSNPQPLSEEPTASKLVLFMLRGVWAWLAPTVHRWMSMPSPPAGTPVLAAWLLEWGAVMARAAPDVRKELWAYGLPIRLPRSGQLHHQSLRRVALHASISPPGMADLCLLIPSAPAVACEAKRLQIWQTLLQEMVSSVANVLIA